jgi:DNA-binding CsgD family transcriptional regulator/tetratricopeptide (TPR) repeat protein
MAPRHARQLPLIERQSELERLTAALDAAAEGRPSVTVVAGEPGIGKTRLLRALGDVARDRGLTVLHGDCLRLGYGELPFAPLAVALREVPAAPLGRMPPAARAEIGLAFPHLAVDAPAPAPRQASDDHAQRRLFDSLICLLGELGRDAPVLLSVDDFQWADRATLAFVAFLAHGAGHEPITIVLACRDDAATVPAIGDVLIDLERLDHAHTLDLPALSRNGVEALTHAALGSRPPPALVDRILTRSRGNPLFAHELVAAYLEGRGARLPAGIRNRALDLLRRVSPEAQHLVRLVAVARRRVGVDLLTATCGLSTVQLNRALREALDYQLLCEEGSPPGFVFRHELLRAAVYEEALHAGERSELHAAIAEHLASTAAPAQAELAFHWQAAGRKAEALLASIRAGLDAERARAYAAAAQDFEAAMQIWAELGSAPAGTPLDEIELAGHLADARRHSGDYTGAIEVCDQVLAGLDETAEPGRAAAFHERIGALNSAHSEVSLERFRAALSLMPGDVSARRARLVAEEALALLGLYRFGEACERAEAALALASAAGSSGEELHAKVILGHALGLAGRLDEGERWLRLAIEEPPVDALPEDLLRGYLLLGETLRLAGRFDAALATMDAGAALAAEYGLHGSFGWYLEVNAAADLFHLGRWPEADERLTEVRDHPQESWTELTLRQVTGQLALARDQPEARAELEAAKASCAAADPECSPPIYAALAELELWSGALDAARALVETGLAAARSVPDLLYTPALYSVGARVEAEAAAGAIGENHPELALLAHDRAAAHTTDLELRIAGHPGEAPPPTAIAHLATCRAEVQRAVAHLSVIEVGDGTAAWDLAAESWAESRDRWMDAGSPYPAAYAAWRHAEAILRVHHRSRRGADAARAALAAAEQLGAARLQRAVEALVAERGIAVGESQLPRGLTAREHQILGLLARGMTNRRIAAELVLSVRTVDVHVSHILAKLDAGNRGEAAAIAHQLGVVGERPEAGARL